MFADHTRPNFGARRRCCLVVLVEVVSRDSHLLDLRTHYRIAKQCQGSRCHSLRWYLVVEGCQTCRKGDHPRHQIFGTRSQRRESSTEPFAMPLLVCCCSLSALVSSRSSCLVDGASVVVSLGPPAQRGLRTTGKKKDIFVGL